MLLPVAAYPSPVPVDCSDIYRAGSGQDGVYTIYPAGPTSAVQVYCDMSRDPLKVTAEKWTVSLTPKFGTRLLSFTSKLQTAVGNIWSGDSQLHVYLLISICDQKKS